VCLIDRSASSAGAGLRPFMGKPRCVNCHNGPLLTNNEFHNTGVRARPGLPADKGPLAGADAVLRDEFNCRAAVTVDRIDGIFVTTRPTSEHNARRTRRSEPY
jgi:cytochrome c peroxidase